jgi:hypothetical protein
MIYANAWPDISIAIAWSLIWYSEDFTRFFGKISMVKDVSVCYLFYFSRWSDFDCEPASRCWHSVEVAGNTV